MAGRAPIPYTVPPMTAPADALRALMREYGLTQPRVAELAGVSLKTVESWLAVPGAVAYRRMAPRHLELIQFKLRAPARKARR